MSDARRGREGRVVGMLVLLGILSLWEDGGSTPSDPDGGAPSWGTPFPFIVGAARSFGASILFLAKLPR